MKKRVMLRYSSHLNITFEGEEELFEFDDEVDYVPNEEFLREEEQTWLNEHVEVYAYVEDVVE